MLPPLSWAPWSSYRDGRVACGFCVVSLTILSRVALCRSTPIRRSPVRSPLERPSSCRVAECYEYGLEVLTLGPRGSAAKPAVRLLRCPAGSCRRSLLSVGLPHVPSLPLSRPTCPPMDNLEPRCRFLWHVLRVPRPRLPRLHTRLSLPQVPESRHADTPGPRVDRSKQLIVPRLVRLAQALPSLLTQFRVPLSSLQGDKLAPLLHCPSSLVPCLSALVLGLLTLVPVSPPVLSLPL